MQNYSGEHSIPKRYCLRKLPCLDYIKLHGVYSNPLGTVAVSGACHLHLQADQRSTLVCRTFFCGIFPLLLIQEKQASFQLMAKQNGRLTAKKKLAQGGLPRKNTPPPPHNVKIHIMNLKEGGVPTKLFLSKHQLIIDYQTWYQI